MRVTKARKMFVRISVMMSVMMRMGVKMSVAVVVRDGLRLHKPMPGVLLMLAANHKRLVTSGRVAHRQASAHIGDGWII